MAPFNLPFHSQESLQRLILKSWFIFAASLPLLFISTSVRYTSKILSKLDRFSPHLHISTQTNYHHLLPDSSHSFLALLLPVPTVQAILQRRNSKIRQNEVFPKAHWATKTQDLCQGLQGSKWTSNCPSLCSTLPTHLPITHAHFTLLNFPVLPWSSLCTRCFLSLE